MVIRSAVLWLRYQFSTVIFLDFWPTYISIFHAQTIKCGVELFVWKYIMVLLFFVKLIDVDQVINNIPAFRIFFQISRLPLYLAHLASKEFDWKYMRLFNLIFWQAKCGCFWILGSSKFLEMIRFKIFSTSSSEPRRAIFH